MTRKSNVRNVTKFKRSVKAISPVIATLLMIAITVVAALVAYAWVSGYIGGTTAKTGNEIQISSYATDPTTGNLELYVQNVGQGTVTLNPSGAVYANDTLISISTVNGNPPGQSVTIPAGQTVALIVPWAFPLGDYVRVKVVTSGGTYMQTSGTSTGGPSNNNPNLIQVTFQAGGSGTGTFVPASGSFTLGQQFTITATPTGTSTFSGWAANPAGSVTFANAAAASTTATVNAAGSVTATFTAAQVSVTFQTGGTGTGTVLPTGTASYNVGQQVAVTATPTGGSTFGGWTAVPVGSVTFLNAAAASTTATIVSAGTVTATLTAPVQYSIVVTQGANGVIAPGGTTSYNAGSTPGFTITPNSGYVIASITTNAGAQTVTNSAGETYTFPALSASDTLTATFAAKAVATLGAVTLSPVSPITLGGSTTPSATVSGTGVTPTGTVTFYYSTDSGSTWNTLGTGALSGGSATCGSSYNPQASGSNYAFRASYGGDTNYNSIAASGTGTSLTVNKNTPTVPAPTLNPVSPIVLGTSVTAAVTIPSAAGVTPTGTVDFQVSTDGGTTFNKFGATKTLASGSATSDAYTPNAVSSNYRFRAVYSGDSNYNTATGSAASLTVNKYTPTVPAPTLNPVSPITYGTSITASVTIPSVAGVTPTGTVTFQVSTDSGNTWSTLGAVKTLASGSATSDSYTPAASGSNYAFRAVYSGDSNYNTATGSAASLTVNSVAPALDVSTSSSASSGNNLVMTLTTTKAKDIIYVSIIEGSGQTVNTITSTGLTWTKRGSASMNSGDATLETWYAVANSIGSVSITVAFTGSTHSTAGVAFAISGANTNSPFDVTNPSTNTGDSTTASTTISSNPNDFIIGAVGIDNNSPSTVTPGTNFHQVTNVQNSGGTRETWDEYYVATTANPSLSVSCTWTGTQYWSIIADAIKPA